MQVIPRCKPHIRVNKLIKHFIVGTCIESCKGVYIKNWQDINFLSEREIPSNIGKKGEGSQNETYSSFIYLYYYCRFQVHCPFHI